MYVELADTRHLGVHGARNSQHKREAARIRRQGRRLECWVCLVHALVRYVRNLLLHSTAVHNLPLTLTLVCQESCRFGVPGAISRTTSSTNASSTLLRRGPFPQKQVPRQRLMRQYVYVCTSEASKLRT
jgi:hypothetical protein